MGRLDPQGEIVPKEFPNPEPPRIWGGGTNWHGPANSYICSFCSLTIKLLTSLFYTVDAMVTV